MNTEQNEQKKLLPNSSDSTESNSEGHKTHTCFQRWFGKIQQGGVRSSMLILAAAAIGPGCLALPNCMKQSGFILGLLLMVLAAVMSLAALYSLFKAAAKSKTSSYAQCTTSELGYLHGVIVQIVLIIYCFGGAIVRMVMIGKILAQFFLATGMTGQFADIDNRLYTAITQCILIGVLYPICIKRDLSSLRYMSMFGVLAILFVVFTLIAQTPNYNQEYSNSDNHIEYFIFDINFPSSFTLGVFVFTNYFVVFQVRGEFHQPTERRINTTILRAVSIEFFIYLSLILPSYFSFFHDMPEIILNRPVLDEHYPHDIAMQICRLIMCIIIFFTIPLIVNGARQGFIILQRGLLKPYIEIPDESLEQKNQRLEEIASNPANNPTKSMSQFYNYSIIALILITSALLTIAYNQIIIYIGILAGFFGCSIALIYPAVLYIKHEKEVNNGQWTAKSIFISIISIIFTLIGFVAGVIDVLRICGVDI